MMALKKQIPIPFSPTPDVVGILNRLLDIYERRGGTPQRTIRLKLADIAPDLPGYNSQTDPLPRATTNDQLTDLARRGLVHLTWQPEQTNHLLAIVALEATQTPPLYALLNREPLAKRRECLRDLLLADRSQLTGWRRQAVQHSLEQLKACKSPAPFSLTDQVWNQDLLAALVALPSEPTREEIPYRVFSVRLYNDSKRFEALKDTLARLARRHHPLWRTLSAQETLCELGLVANPGHLYLYGPWQLVDSEGQVISLAEFHPSVGIPAALAARLQRVTVNASHIICVENLASFYELIRHKGLEVAALCLWGNPSPACRHLLRCLVAQLPPTTTLQLWADIDYGGLNILAHLRRHVSPRFQPYHMDQATLDSHARWGQPLSATDRRNLSRLRSHPALTDMTALIEHILQREIKLEQEAVIVTPRFL